MFADITNHQYVIMKKLFLGTTILTTLLASYSFTLQTNADAILGSWKNGEGTGIIQIYKNADKYQGKITWLKEPNDPETGIPKLDKNHPDEKTILLNPGISILLYSFLFSITVGNCWRRPFSYSKRNK